LDAADIHYQPASSEIPFQKVMLSLYKARFMIAIQFSKAALTTLLALAWQFSWAQGSEVPEREEGEGQYERLVLRGAYIIDGTGAPAYGPADVVVENDRISEI